MNSDTELDVFKREIDLRQFAATLGYEMDRRESWRGSTVLRCGGDKIVVKRNHNGHYVFFSVRDDRDNGTIIDFVQRRQHLNLGAVRQTLRPWIGRPAAALPSFPKLAPASPDRVQVETEYRRMVKVLRHPYIWSRCAVCRRPCWAARGLPAGCGSTAAAMPYFHISTARVCVDMRSRTNDSRVLPPAAKRVCGFRADDRMTGVWS